MENSSKTLDDILNSQILSSDKTRLGYNKRNYAAALMNQIEKKDSQKIYHSSHNRDTTYTIPIRPMTSKYQLIFFCHC